MQNSLSVCVCGGGGGGEGTGEMRGEELGGEGLGQLQILVSYGLA